MQHADRLDRAQALTRPGRIDRKVSVPLPDENGRRAILALHARRLSIELEVSGATPRPDAEDPLRLAEIAAQTSGFSGTPRASFRLRSGPRSESDLVCAGADLANLVNEAAMLAVRDGKENVSSAHFRMALGKAVEEKRLMATSTQTTREDNAGGGLQLPPDLARFMENMMGGPRQPAGGGGVPATPQQPGGGGKRPRGGGTGGGGGAPHEPELD